MDHRRQIETTGRGQGEFGVEQIALRDQHVQIVRQAAFIAEIGESQRRLQRIDLSILRRLLLASGADAHQRIFNFFERNEDRLLVLGHRLTSLSLGRILLEPECLRIQQRAGQPRTQHPEIAAGGKQLR